MVAGLRRQHGHRVAELTDIHAAEVTSFQAALQERDEELSRWRLYISSGAAASGGEGRGVPSPPVADAQRLGDDNDSDDAGMVELLQARIGAMEEVMAAYDRRAAERLVAAGGDAGADDGADAAEGADDDALLGPDGVELLTRWRSKVFSLILEKTMDAAQLERERADHQRMRAELEAARARAHDDMVLLKHHLAERNAQLKVLQSSHLAAQGERDQAIERADELAAVAKAQATSLAEVKAMVVSFAKHVGVVETGADEAQEEGAESGCVQSVMSQLRACGTRVRAMDDRVRFASGRVQLLQNMLDRRVRDLVDRLRTSEQERQLLLSNAMAASDGRDGDGAGDDGDAAPRLLLSLQGGRDAGDFLLPPSDGGRGDVASSGVEVAHLKKEIARLAAERSYLSKLRAEDAERTELAVKAARDEAEKALLERDNQVALLQHELAGLQAAREAAEQEHASERATSHAELAAAQSSLEEAREREEALRVSLKDAQLELRRQEAGEVARVQNAVLEERERANGPLLAMQRECGLLRREHTKATVVVQQLERQLERKTERENHEAALREEQLQAKLNKMERRLQAAQKERNTLVSIIQQRSHLPVPDGKPAEPPLRKAARPVPTAVSAGAAAAAIREAAPTADPTLLLAEVRALSHDVLSVDGDDDDDGGGGDDDDNNNTDRHGG